MGQAHSRPREIIPACVKNRWKKFRGFDGCRGHPRVCGEQLMIKNLDSVYEKSSPRVRGAVALQVESTLAFRIIPECVGSRNCRSLRWCC